MIRVDEGDEIILLCVIVDQGKGSKVLQSSKQLGITGGTILYGRGLAHNFVAQFIGLDTRKEVILMAGNQEIVYNCIGNLKETFDIDSPGEGIAFTLKVCGLIGTKECDCEKISEESGSGDSMYKLIMTIVDKGKSQDVIQAAIKGGAIGGTVISGRGSGIHETQKVFAVYIEPEKEVIIIVSETDKTKGIVDSIRRDLEMDDPGNGIVFLLNINEAYGLYKE